jgi:hypothetical protein
MIVRLEPSGAMQLKLLMLERTSSFYIALKVEVVQHGKWGRSATRDAKIVGVGSIQIGK